MITSPLEPILGAHRAILPDAFRRQFLSGADPVVVEGTMHSIWYRPLFAPLFRLLGGVGILVPETARTVPTTMHIIPGTDDSGQVSQLWNRRFDLGEGRHYDFNTVVLYDAERDCVVDLVGPGLRLHLGWIMTFEPPRLLTIHRKYCGIRIGGRVRWLPHWLWPLLLGREDFKQRIDEGDEDMIHIDLRVRHPIFGLVFRYQGTFIVG